MKWLNSFKILKEPVIPLKTVQTIKQELEIESKPLEIEINPLESELKIASKNCSILHLDIKNLKDKLDNLKYGSVILKNQLNDNQEECLSLVKQLENSENEFGKKVHIFSEISAKLRKKDCYVCEKEIGNSYYEFNKIAGFKNYMCKPCLIKKGIYVKKIFKLSDTCTDK